jgi:hypothetical protein
MKEQIVYQEHFFKMLEEAQEELINLPASLQDLIEKFENAQQALNKADEATQEKWIIFLIQTDAVISAQVYGLFKDKFQDSKVDKVKLMAMKAKALQLKWKMKQE